MWSSRLACGAQRLQSTVSAEKLTKRHLPHATQRSAHASSDGSVASYHLPYVLKQDLELGTGESLSLCVPQ